MQEVPTVRFERLPITSIIYWYYQADSQKLVVWTPSSSICAWGFPRNEEAAHKWLAKIFSGYHLEKSKDSRQQDLFLNANGSPMILQTWGTAFQEVVWRELLKIPLGLTCSYSDIAKAIGNPNAVRPVGSAVGANRIAEWIPCHRVLNKNGNLGGYAWGLDKKRELLRKH